MSLRKLVKYVLYQPPDIVEYIPAWSESVNSGNIVTLSSSGLPYILSYLNARGYNATVNNVTVLSVGLYYADVFFVPHRNTLGDYQWVNVGHVPLRKQDVIDRTNVTYINHPAQVVNTTPKPIFKPVPNVGWNGGANSLQSFVSKGYGQFSISPLSVGVFIGLSKKSLAILDSHYANIEYSIYAHLGTYSCYVSGKKVSTDFTYTSTDVFKIEITSTLVNYYKNDVVVHFEYKDTDFEEYVLDASEYYTGDSVYNYTLVQDPNLINISSSIPIEGKIYNTDKVFINSNIEYSSSFTLDNTLPIDILGSILYEGRVFPKDYTGILGEILYSSTMDVGLEVPYIPFNLVGEIPFIGYIRDNYVFPAQMFVIT